MAALRRVFRREPSADVEEELRYHIDQRARVAALMVGVGLLAALGPARRGLAVQPTEAPREE